MVENAETKYETPSHTDWVISGAALMDHLKSEKAPTGKPLRARGGFNRGAPSGPPSKYRVFSPPTVANHTQNGNGNGNGGNTGREI